MSFDRVFVGGRIAVLAACRLACSSIAAALTPAIQFDPVATRTNLDDGFWFEPSSDLVTSLAGKTVGWGFRLSEAATLAAVGVYDFNADGLQGVFEIGVWRADDGTFDDDPIASATISELDTDAPLVDGFRTVDIQPLTLPPGEYTVGALQSPLSVGFPIPRPGPDPAPETFFWNFDTNDFPDGFLQVPVDPRVELFVPGEIGEGGFSSLPAFATADGFREPDSGLLVTGAFVGPNLYFVPIPEPTSAALTLTFAAWLVSVRRRRTVVR